MAASITPVPIDVRGIVFRPAVDTPATTQRHPQHVHLDVVADDRPAPGQLSHSMPYVSDQVQYDRTPRAVEAVLMTASVYAYGLAFTVLYKSLGLGSATLVALPVLLLAWFWGWHVGVAAARRRRFEREIRDRAEELLRLKSAFLNNMSHELRTPLTAILGFAEILSEEGDPTHREFAERILSSGVRLQRTLDSVLDFAQLEGGALKLDVRRLNVAGHVRAVADCFAVSAEQKGLDLMIHVPDDPVESELDPASLHRVVQCLVENAVKFTSVGYVAVDVTADESHAFIRVRDSGIGITESFLPHVFSEFRQESMGHARAYEGSGLGLSVTKRLVELHGGSVSVQSRHGEGSTFTVSFPRTERRNGELSKSFSKQRITDTMDHFIASRTAA